MSQEITGYYCQRQRALLDDFGLTLQMMTSELGAGLDSTQTEAEPERLKEALLAEYERIIPEIPYFKGHRQGMFNNMLLITAQVIAAYRVLGSQGKSPEEIWDLCHKALRARLDGIPGWKRKLARYLWHSVFARMLKRRGRRRLKESLGLFTMEYLDGDGEAFDFGINYTRCGHREFLDRQQALEMLPYVCLADIALSDAFGWGLRRTQTIGDGCEYCDFRFKRGASTQVTSSDPRVQAMIDRTTSRATR